MKWLTLAATALIAAFCLALVTKQTPGKNQPAFQKKNVIRCSPDWNSLALLLDETDIPPMPGAGRYQWKITAAHDSAQFYFNQGMNMYYGFHIIEALASFKKAARFEPSNAMAWWAQALAYGPNINDYGYAASPEALEAVEKARMNSANNTPVEKGLMEAMALRYSPDSTHKREELNQAYADAMRKLQSAYPRHQDVAALYADALMLQHPWELWNNDGTPKPWTPAIRKVLETLLAHFPNHPGANHYYIHVMEASPSPEKALASARRLGQLTPGLSHMVHMPSHIFLRTGDYKTGASINEQAVDWYKQYSQTFTAVQQNPFLYEWHNLHMQANCHLLAGNFEKTTASASRLQQVIDTSVLSAAAPIGTLVQYLYMTPVFVNIRFKKWQEILQMQPPARHHTYALLLYHFGRGMAYAATNNFTAAELEQNQLQALATHPELKIAMPPFSAYAEGARCADEMLKGQIALHKGDLEEAIVFFGSAAMIEGNMVYNEPRDWFISPKPFLGEACLLKGRWADAEQAFKMDLKTNNNNFWSLKGLHQALVKQNKLKAAGEVQSRILKVSAPE